MPSLVQKHAHVKGQRSNHHIFKFQPNPSWAKKRPNRYTSFEVMKLFSCSTQLITKLQLLMKPKIPTNVEGSCWHFNIYEQDKFRAQLNGAWHFL